MDTSACVIGSSQATRELRQDVELAAQSSMSVLISGESGVGKKMLARRIHQCSARASRRFSVLECDRVRSAVELYVGVFESADGGTLLLDEVSEMASAVQEALLTLLGTPDNAKPIGRFADVRLIACTHPKIARQMTTHEFSDALYYRLNTMYLRIPPVRERPEDIPALVHYFVRQKASDAGRCALNVSFDAMRRFVAYDWPGNLKEIQQVVEVLASSDVVRSTIQAHSLPADLASISSTGRETAHVAPQAGTMPLRVDRPAALERPSISAIEIKAIDESLLEFASEAIPNHQPSLAQSEVSRTSSLLRSMLQRACASAVAVSVSTVTAAEHARVRVKASWTGCIAEALRRAHQAGRLGTHAVRAIAADAARTFSSPSFVFFGWGVVTGGLVVFAVTAGPPMQGVITIDDRLSGSATTAPAEGRVDLVAMAGSREAPLSPVGVMSAVSPNQAGSPKAGSPMPQPAALRGTASFRGSLAVTSFPSGAHVRLNGRPAGRTPLTLKNLPVGSRAVRLELERYQPWSSTIQVVTNQRTIVMADLRRTVAR